MACYMSRREEITVDGDGSDDLLLETNGGSSLYTYGASWFSIVFFTEVKSA
jgi:hypothetical protein